MNLLLSSDELCGLLSRVQTELPRRCSDTKKLLENLPDRFRELGTDVFKCPRIVMSFFTISSLTSDRQTV